MIEQTGVVAPSHGLRRVRLGGGRACPAAITGSWPGLRTTQENSARLALRSAPYGSSAGMRGLVPTLTARY
jgi:hypothetical protein